MARMRAPTGMSSPRRPRRIAQAVPALVMAEHELAHGRAERHVAEDLGADPRVNLDALELLGRERLGLREDVLGHRHVADVVQQRRRAHRLHVAVGEADRFGQRRRVLLDGSDVLGRAARLGFDRERERFDGRRAAPPSRGAFDPAPPGAARRPCGNSGRPGRAARPAAPASRTSRVPTPRWRSRPAPRRPDSSARSTGSCGARCAPPAAASRARSRRRPAPYSRRSTAAPPPRRPAPAPRRSRRRRP